MKVRVLFVCLGNICRSPTAEGIFRKLVEEAGLTDYIEVDSAGTHAYHIGEPPDPRAVQAASRRGVDLSWMRGRQATRDDLRQFDYVLAMDRDNLGTLQDMADDVTEHIRLLLQFAQAGVYEDEVPDPYFGGPTGFERVLDMIEAAAQGLLQDIRARHRLP